MWCEFMCTHSVSLLRTNLTSTPPLQYLCMGPVVRSAVLPHTTARNMNITYTHNVELSAAYHLVLSSRTKSSHAHALMRFGLGCVRYRRSKLDYTTIIRRWAQPI